MRGGSWRIQGGYCPVPPNAAPASTWLGWAEPPTTVTLPGVPVPQPLPWLWGQRGGGLAELLCRAEETPPPLSLLAHLHTPSLIL